MGYGFQPARSSRLGERFGISWGSGGIGPIDATTMRQVNGDIVRQRKGFSSWYLAICKDEIIITGISR